jgi:ribosomal-protein-alanine N-acetyltransferase
LRRAAAADGPLVAGVIRAVFPAGWSEASLAAEPAREDAEVWLAEAEGQPIGAALLRVAAGEAEILTVAVAPAWRRQGVAAALCRRALGAVAARGAVRAHLEVRSDNGEATQLYEGLGFRQVGLRRGYYRDPPGDARLMSRELIASPGRGD